MNANIVVTQETRDRLRKFKNAVGVDYDESLTLLLDLVTDNGRVSPQVAGARISLAREHGKVIPPVRIPNGD